MFQLVGQMLSGLIVGTVARLLMPRGTAGSLFLAALSGLLGSLLGTLLGHAVLGEPHRAAEWLFADGSALCAVRLYRLTGRRLGYGQDSLDGQER